jgi:hypothetical protein
MKLRTYVVVVSLLTFPIMLAAGIGFQRDVASLPGPGSETGLLPLAAALLGLFLPPIVAACLEKSGVDTSLAPMDPADRARSCDRIRRALWAVALGGVGIIVLAAVWHARRTGDLGGLAWMEESRRGFGVVPWGPIPVFCYGYYVPLLWWSAALQKVRRGD